MRAHEIDRIAMCLQTLPEPDWRPWLAHCGMTRREIRHDAEDGAALPHGYMPRRAIVLAEDLRRRRAER